MTELIKEKILDDIEDKYLSEAMDYAKSTIGCAFRWTN